MEFLSTNIPDVIIVEPKVFTDERGFFMETFQKKDFQVAGIPYEFAQENHSGSKGGVLRGLHYQIQQTQGKLVRTISGEIFDVAVDIRKGSSTFRQWLGVILSSENKRMLWIPEGFAHGFYVLSNWAEVVYKATDFYAPQWERSIIWNDPVLNIDWPVKKGFPPILSEKDSAGVTFEKAEVFE